MIPNDHIKEKQNTNTISKHGTTCNSSQAFAPAGVDQLVRCCPQTKRSLVQFPVRAHAWPAGFVLGGGAYGGANLCFSLTSMFLSLIFSLASPLSKTERNLKNSTQAFDYFAIIFYHMFSHLILNRISSLLCMWSDIWIIWRIRLTTYILELSILQEPELLNMQNPPKDPIMCN